MDLEFHQMAMTYSHLRIRLPGSEARLLASIAAEGQLQPVLVVERSSETSEPYVLIDGYLRVNALRRLGRDTVEAMVLPLSEAGALIFRRCQERSHQRSALEDSWLLRELNELHGLSQAELSRQLQRSESWVSRRLSLIRELSESAQDLVRRGVLCDHGAMKYLVPLARAKKSDCERLVGQLAQRRTSSRELEQIYICWKQGNAEQRKRVVQHPHLFLKTAEELKREPKEQPGDQVHQVLKDLEILDAVSSRARRHLRGVPARALLPDRVHQAWQGAQSSFAALAAAMERHTDAGRGNQNGDPAAQSQGARGHAHRSGLAGLADHCAKGHC